MTKLRILSAALVTIWAASAIAQSSAPTPVGPNSGAGVQGLPGNKNGPAVAPNTPSNSSADQSGTKQNDVSKVPGAPGGKSGPAVKPDSQK